MHLHSLIPKPNMSWERPSFIHTFDFWLIIVSVESFCKLWSAPMFRKPVLGGFGAGTLTLLIGCLLVLKPDKLGMCRDLWEALLKISNYADISPTAMSGHVLTDIPKQLRDAHWVVCSSHVCLHYIFGFCCHCSLMQTRWEVSVTDSWTAGCL